MALKMYILVNEDIKIGKGKLAGQVGHAVASYMYHTVKYNGNADVFDDYMNSQQKKIILKCPQSKLEELEERGFATIRDNGLTQLEPNTLTCVNFGIISDLLAPEWIKELKLV